MKNMEIEEKLLDIWQEEDKMPENPAEISNNLSVLHSAMGVNENSGKARSVTFRIAAVAAALAVFAAGEFFLVRSLVTPPEKVNILSADGSKGRYTLPDGSVVWLNSSSRLSYDASSPRNVTIYGEAFFDVVKNGEPFVVNTDEFSVKVLGTRFNVRNSDVFGADEVSLLSGKVELSAGGQSLLLHPGEKASCRNGHLEKEEYDVTLDASWTGSELNFENTSLAEILTSLEHWYNVDMQIASGVNVESRYSFKIRKESIDEALGIIGRLSRCRFKRLDNTHIIITK